MGVSTFLYIPLYVNAVAPFAAISGDNPPAGVTETGRVDNGDGTFTVTYSDGTKKVIGTKTQTGKKIVRQYYSGSGAARVQITEYDDGTKDTTPAPEAAAGLSADDVNKLIQAAVANQNAEFQKMLAAQQKQLETAKAEQVAAQRKSAFDVAKRKLVWVCKSFYTRQSFICY